MDLIYTDAEGVENGILTHFSMDHEEASDSEKNTFEIKASIVPGLELGSLIYAEDTEFGGRITKIVIDTSKSSAVYSGITWLGLLSQKIIRPDDGQDYLYLSGDLNEIIRTLIARCDFSSYFYVSEELTIELSNYKFNRYVTLFDGIIKMLSAYGYKLKVKAIDAKIELAAVPIVDFQQTEEINSDLFSFKLTKQKYTCNHLIALGSGELAARLIVDKYVQKDGTIGNNQFYFGKDEVVEIYDASNIADITELSEKAVEELKKKAVNDGLSITAYNLRADIGDKITAINLKYKISVTQYVINKIISINDDYIKYQYKVGDTL